MKLTKFFSIIFLGLLLQANFEVYCYSIKESINNCKIKVINAVQKLKENKGKLVASAAFLYVCGLGLWYQRGRVYKELTPLHKFMIAPFLGFSVVCRRFEGICDDIMEFYKVKFSGKAFIPGEPL